MNAPLVSASCYSFPERALRRWQRENLTLTSRADGGFDAIFRFEGSTCGNIAFFLHYHLTLAPATAAHRILSMHCTPVPFDEGHARMCCWQENATAIATTMRDDAPLLGQPLSAVLDWRPRKSPAGCLCSEPARHHKWQAILETIHIALNSRPASSLSPHPTTSHEN